MKYRLLTSTAVSALLAASSFAYAEGMTLNIFGGLNFAGEEKFDGKIITNSSTGSFATKTEGISGVADFDADTGYIFGGAIGYKWDNGLILELESAYRRNQLDIVAIGEEFGTKHFFTPFTKNSISDTKTFLGPEVGLHGDEGHISAVSLMANAWYEFNLANQQWKPYIGGGVGIAWLDMHGLANGGYGTNDSSTSVIGFHGTESGFAWQLGAGIGYEFAPGKQVTFDYRYFNGPSMDNVQFHEIENDIDYDYSAHNVMIGMRFAL